MLHDSAPKQLFAGPYHVFENPPTRTKGRRSLCRYVLAEPLPENCTDEDELVALLRLVEVGDKQPTLQHITDARFCIERLREKLARISLISNG